MYIQTVNIWGLWTDHKNHRDSESISNINTIARRRQYRVVLSMGVTVIIGHCLVPSHFIAIVLWKIKKDCRVDIVKERNYLYLMLACVILAGFKISFFTKIKLSWALLFYCVSHLYNLLSTFRLSDTWAPTWKYNIKLVNWAR